MSISLTVTDEVDEEIRRAILAPLVEYNNFQAGPSGGQPLAVLVKNEAGEIIGGLWGTTAYEWLFTQLLVVPAQSRSNGMGSEIMRLAEDEAVVEAVMARGLIPLGSKRAAFMSVWVTRALANLPTILLATQGSL